MLAATPATPNQVGAIQREFMRLGFGADRAGRLAASAALLNLPDLQSTADLCQGEAGELLRNLQSFRSRGELTAALPRRASPWRDLIPVMAEALSAMLGMQRNGLQRPE
jgi:hypothetical protein